jgi:protein associated with RNAse G/E
MLDVLVKPDGEFKLVDLEEFEQHSATFSSAVKQNIEQGKEELLDMIKLRKFPFATVTRQ